MKKIVEQACSLYYGHRKKFLIMRNAILMLLISSLQVFATGTYSQTKQLNLNLKDVTIKEALTAIENQSEFYFLYNSELIDVTRKVEIQAKGEKVDEILAQLFDKNEVDFLIKDRYIVLTPVGGNEVLFDQQKTISGKVTDSRNQPLPGVTVLVKGTATGAVTNTDGNYSIQIPSENVVLQFSFVGMKTQDVATGNQTIINVVMEEETIGLEEVVAVGYGTSRKKDVTGAVAVVSSKEFESRSTVQIGDALQGKIAGILSAGLQVSHRLVTISGSGGYQPLLQAVNHFS